MKTMKKWLATTTLFGALALVPACQPASMNGGKPAEAAPAAPVDVGAPLYAAAAMPSLPASTPLGEPIVIPNAVVQNDLRMQLPAAVDGIVDMVATIVPKGTAINPNDPDILYHPRDDKREQPYRRLRAGDVVRKGDLLARMDEQAVYLQMDMLKNTSKSLDDLLVSELAAELSQLEVYEATKNVPGVSNAEKKEREATYHRYKASRLGKVQEKVKNDGEYKTADATYRRYFCMAPINGRIVRIIKQPGEYAKAGETILEIQSNDRVSVEGKLDAGFAASVKRGMKVYVEPSRPVGPNPLTNYHRQEVTAVAVTAHPGRPMIVSGGMDAAALVWDVTSTKQSHRLANPLGVGVKSVAATGAKAKGHFVAVGGDDGKIRIWDITNPDKLPKEPSALFEDSHAGAVTAMAYSPDGKYLATASGRDVFLWNVAEKKKMYALPSDHRSGVTTLRFTPQATLVTVSQDKSIRTWKLGDKAAAAATMIDHRGGSVDVLGVSSDGARVLFDKDPSRLDLVSLADERSVGTVQSAGGGARFAVLAIFSADDNQILTVGADNDQKGIVTEWDTPAPGNRGSERRQLVTPKNSAVTCAAFSPDATHRFIAVGTADGGVYFWTQTAGGEERSKRIVGEVVSIVPRDARSFDIKVEMPSTSDKNGEVLQDRSTATIIIPPEGINAAAAVPNVVAPAAPLPAVIVPAGGNVPAMPKEGLIPAGAVAPANPIVPAAPLPTVPVVPASPVVK